VAGRHELLEDDLAHVDDAMLEKYLADEGAHGFPRSRNAIRPRDAADGVSCRCCAAPRSRTRAVAADARRGRRLLARRRSTFRPPKVSARRASPSSARPARTSRSPALAFKIVADPVRAKAPRTSAIYLGHASRRAREIYKLHQGPQGAHRSHPAYCTPTSCERHRTSRTRGDIVAGLGFKQDDHRRPALRAARARGVILEADGVPDAGDLGRDRAEDEGPTRTSLARRSALAPPTKTPRSWCTPTSTRARRSSRAWGGAAPRGARRPGWMREFQRRRACRQRPQVA